jgi:hypothetical protein
MEADNQADAVPFPRSNIESPMNYRLEEPGYRRRDVITIPILWLWIAASLLVHVAALFLLIPKLNMESPENTQLSDAQDRIEVQLTRPPSPPPAPPSAAAPQTQAVIVPQARTPPRKPAPRPPVLTAPPRPSEPATPALPPTPPVVAQPQKTPPPMAGDLSSYIEARRRERGEETPPEPTGAPGTAPPVQSGNGRLNDSLAANLPSAQSPIDGRDRKKGGGIFQIKSMAYDDAEFEFYGWNNDVDRKTIQRIEVRKGNNSDMRIAVVRRMIAIIRLHAQGDFTWESQRLGKNVTLSARPGDNDGLEAFLMQEFFEDNRVR